MHKKSYNDTIRSGALSALRSADTGLFPSILLIVREYMIVQKCNIQGRKSGFRDACSLCTCTTSLIANAKVIICLARKYDGVILNHKGTDGALHKRFMPIPDEQTANKYGISLHTPSIDCEKDCKSCTNIVENYYVPKNKYMTEIKYIDHKDLFTSLCPFYVIKKWGVKKRLQKFHSDIESINLEAYIEQFHGDEYAYQHVAIRHLFIYRWPGTCIICNGVNNLSHFQVGGATMQIPLCNSQKAVPCWKYLFFTEPKWQIP
jgi:hypothetical protein